MRVEGARECCHALRTFCDNHFLDAPLHLLRLRLAGLEVERTLHRVVEGTPVCAVESPLVQDIEGERQLCGSAKFVGSHRRVLRALILLWTWLSRTVLRRLR